MLRYFISFFTFLVFLPGFSQNQPNDVTQEQDSTRYKQRYGLRIGLDVFAPVYSMFDPNFQGFEIVADYRITNRIWAAGEWGYTNNLSKTDYIDFYTKGTYYKFGADYNTYNNWPGMENMIYAGLRYGIAFFDQEITEYIINNDPFLPPVVKNDPVEYTNLSGQWIEGILGIKVETFKNLYMGLAFSGKYMITSKEPENFKNMYMPGFYRVSVNKYGFGFSYTLSYLLPFYRK